MSVEDDSVPVFPERFDPAWALLTPEQRGGVLVNVVGAQGEVILALSALLRVAEGLDMQEVVSKLDLPTLQRLLAALSFAEGALTVGLPTDRQPNEEPVVPESAPLPRAAEVTGVEVVSQGQAGNDLAGGELVDGSPAATTDALPVPPVGLEPGAESSGSGDDPDDAEEATPEPVTPLQSQMLEQIFGDDFGWRHERQLRHLTATSADALLRRLTVDHCTGDPEIRADRLCSYTRGETQISIASRQGVKGPSVCLSIKKTREKLSAAYVQDHTTFADAVTAILSEYSDSRSESPTDSGSDLDDGVGGVDDERATSGTDADASESPAGAEGENGVTPVPAEERTPPKPDDPELDDLLFGMRSFCDLRGLSVDALATHLLVDPPELNEPLPIEVQRAAIRQLSSIYGRRRTRLPYRSAVQLVGDAVMGHSRNEAIPVSVLAGRVAAGEEGAIAEAMRRENRRFDTSLLAELFESVRETSRL